MTTVLNPPGRRGLPIPVGWPLAAALTAVLVVPFALVALATATGFLVLPDPLAAVEARVPVVFRIHMASGALALFAVPLAFAVRGHSAWHRPLGRLAGLLVLIAGLSALPVALASTAGPAARLAFATQAVVWLALLSCGTVAIRRRRRDLHRAAMIGLCAVTSAAIWLRPASALAVHAGLDFEVAYAVIAWGSWLVPLMIVAPFALAAIRRPEGAGRARVANDA
jgi:hypothetical protein